MERENGAIIDRLDKLVAMRSSKFITDYEFQVAKADLFGIPFRPQAVSSASPMASTPQISTRSTN